MRAFFMYDYFFLHDCHLTVRTLFKQKVAVCLAVSFKVTQSCPALFGSEALFESRAPTLTLSPSFSGGASALAHSERRLSSRAEAHSERRPFTGFVIAALTA